MADIQQTRLKAQYDADIRKKLVEQFGYTRTISRCRALEKVVRQHGHRRGRERPQEGRQRRRRILTLIAGQKPVITISRKSIATYKLRENQPIGCKVTLRKARMYEFIDRLITVALPRVRDFRGLNPKSFDGRGNYSLGLKEHIIFPEIDYDKVTDIWGMDITVCTTARHRRRSARLLTALNFLFRQ